MAFSQQFYPLSYYNSKQIKNFAENLSEIGENPDKIFNLRVDAAKNPPIHIKTVTEADLPFICPDVFAGGMGEEILSEMTIKQLEIIGRKGSLFLKTAIKMAARKAMIKGKPISRIKEYVDYSPAWQ